MGLWDQDLWGTELWDSQTSTSGPPAQVLIPIGVPVRAVYEKVCDVLLEPLGLSIFCTEADFLRIIRSVAEDFLHRTGIAKKLSVAKIDYAVREYVTPDWIAEPQHLFVDEALIFEGVSGRLDHVNSDWQQEFGGPVEQWYQDHLPPKTIGLYPAPQIQGVRVECPSGLYGTIADYGSATTLNLSCPSGMYGVIGSIEGEIFWDSAGPAFGTMSELLTSSTNLTTIGIGTPSVDEWTLDTVIDLIPDTFVHVYFPFAVLAKIFSTDGEAKDLPRARYCSARYEEGVNFAKAIMVEKILEEPQNARR